MERRMKKKVNEFEIIYFSNGITLNGKLISKACSKALKAIENELPDIYEKAGNSVAVKCKTHSCIYGGIRGL